MFIITDSKDNNFVRIEAVGNITKQDYSDNLEPFLDKIKGEKRRIKVLFHAGVDFEGYNIEAFWEDFKLSLHHLHTFEKCAIVTDVSWIRNSCRFFSPLIPFSVKIFTNSDLSAAQDWIGSEQTINCDLDKKTALLTVEIHNSLSAEDFAILSEVVDPWLEKNGKLEGLVIHVKEFPYWENIYGLFSHISFAKNHHRDIKKVALVADGFLPNVMPKLTDHFVKAQIKNFHYNQLQDAKDWVLN